MHVQVQHLLPALPAVVDDDSESALTLKLQALFRRKPGSQHQYFTKQWRIALIHKHQRLDVLFRDQQKMHRRPRVDVVEGEDVIVFEELFRRDFAGGDFAEQAVGVVGHGGSTRRSYSPPCPATLMCSQARGEIRHLQQSAQCVIHRL